MTGVTAMTLRMSMSISVPEYGPYTTPIMPFTKPTPTQIPKLKKPVFRETYSFNLFLRYKFNLLLVGEKISGIYQ